MIQRAFNYSQEILVQYAINLLSFLEEDLDAFIAFDPDLGATKRDEMATLTNWALGEGGDEMNVAKLGDTTEKVLEELENSRRLYNQLRYWVSKTFPKRKAVQRQFGIGRFTKIADSQESMVSFMTGLVESVEDYRTVLEGSGAPASLLDSVAGQALTLQEANNAQEKKKGNRTVDTEERISQLNVLYQHTKEYNAAAEFVFYDSPAMRDRYRPPSNHAGLEEEIDSEL